MQTPSRQALKTRAVQSKLRAEFLTRLEAINQAHFSLINQATTTEELMAAATQRDSEITALKAWHQSRLDASLSV